jgi:hypothetical protein
MQKKIQTEKQTKSKPQKMSNKCKTNTNRKTNKIQTKENAK